MPNATMEVSNGDFLGPIFNTASALFIILAVLFLGFYLLRKFGPKSIQNKGKDGPSLAGRLFLGSKQSIAIVKIKDKKLVLGVTEQQINLLSEIRDDQNEQETGAENDEDEFTSFAEMLGKNKPGSDSESSY